MAKKPTTSIDIKTMKPAENSAIEMRNSCEIKHETINSKSENPFIKAQKPADQSTSFKLINKFAPYFKKRTFAEFDNDIKSTTKISKGNSNTNTNRTEREERQTRLKALNQRALNRRLLKANPNPCAAPKARLTTLNRSRVTEREQKNQAVQRLDVATWESEDMIEARIEHFEAISKPKSFKKQTAESKGPYRCTSIDLDGVDLTEESLTRSQKRELAAALLQSSV